MTMALIEHDDILDTTRERFVDVVLQDEELLLLEFEVIIGSGPPRVTTCRGHRRSRQGSGPIDARRAPSATAHLAPTLEPWARERSPPPQPDAHPMQVRATGRASSRPGAIGRPHLSQMP